MKIYCSCCDKVQPVRIDNCRDAKTNEPFQDIVCAECHLVIASGTDIAEQEPVAWIQPNHLQKARQAPFLCRVEPKQRDDFVPLYITPFHRKPLTDVTIWNTYKNLWMFHPAEEPRLAGDVLKFARAIEAAHGIKE